MSVIQYESYLEMLKKSQDDYKAETLRIQRKFLFSIQSHHRLWANEAQDSEVAQYHMETVVQLQKIIEQYDKTLERYYLTTPHI